jgi:hypothetical protein
VKARIEPYLDSRDRLTRLVRLVVGFVEKNNAPTQDRQPPVRERPDDLWGRRGVVAPSPSFRPCLSTSLCASPERMCGHRTGRPHVAVASIGGRTVARTEEPHALKLFRCSSGPHHVRHAAPCDSPRASRRVRGGPSVPSARRAPLSSTRSNEQHGSTVGDSTAAIGRAMRGFVMTDSLLAGVRRG